jgi:hypothetical protein
MMNGFGAMRIWAFQRQKETSKRGVAWFNDQVGRFEKGKYDALEFVFIKMLLQMYRDELFQEEWNEDDV